EGVVDTPAAEPDQVAVADLGPDGDPAFGGLGADPPHRGGVAGVEATGHIGRCDDVEEGGVVTEAPNAKTLAEIRVEIHEGTVVASSRRLLPVPGFARIFWSLPVFEEARCFGAVIRQAGRMSHRTLVLLRHAKADSPDGI